MHKFKTAGKILGLTLACLFATGLITGLFYEKEIKALIIVEINKNLDTKISVKEFDFSVLRHFPYASLEMKNILVEEVSSSAKKDTLLYSDKLSLLFNISDIFKKDINLKKILVSNGKINIRIDKDGKENFFLLKKSKDQPEKGVVDLERIGLKNVVLNYQDKKANQDYSMMASDAELSGKFSSTQFSLKTKANLFVDHLRIHNINYVDQKPVIIQSGITVDAGKGLYTFDDSSIKIADVQFNVTGGISNHFSDWELNLAIDAKESDIKSLVSILPASYKHYLDKYKSTGKFLFTSTVMGSVSVKKTPNVKIDFSVKDGKLVSGDAEIEKLYFSGTFNHNNQTNSRVEIPALSAYISGHKVEASIRLDDLPDAFLTLSAKTQLNLSEIQPFIKSDTLESLSGDLAMNISYAGKVRELSDLHDGKLFNIKASGNIDISNVNIKLKYNPLEFKNLSGNFSLHNNDVYLKNFSGNISTSDFHLEGVFRNFISFLLIPGQPGDLHAKVTSNVVDLDELLVNKSDINSNDTSYILKFNPRLICELDVNLNTLHFRKFSAGNIHGFVNLKKQIICGQNLQFEAMDGNVRMDATINASRRDSVTMNFTTKFSNVDINRLFYEMENFDQQTMTDKNVKGRLTADVQFMSVWSNDLTLNSKSVRSTSQITVENGELNNFLPIQALGKYIHASDLNHIRFSTMKNNISIANRMIYIPNMDIHSSAINISGNGNHDFDNNLDYHLQLLLSDVIGNKVKSNSNEFGEVADDGLGHSKLFISMYGTVDNPHFTYDHKAAGNKIKNDIAQEKMNIKGLLKKEFGLYKNEPSVQAAKPKNREEMQIDWSNE